MARDLVSVAMALGVLLGPSSSIKLIKPIGIVIRFDFEYGRKIVKTYCVGPTLTDEIGRMSGSHV